MPTTLQFRRGTSSQNDSFTGAAGELTIDTTNDTLRIHDGATAGGFESVKLTGTQNITLNAQADLRFGDSDSSNWVAFQAPATVSSNVTWTLPNADASVSGYALVSDGSGALSWAAAGATISQDNSTNSAHNLYYATATSGALTAVKYHGTTLTFNPSTGVLTATSSAAQYADLAEKYVADADYTPGTVLVFGGDEEVTQSTQQMDRAVAGIVSTNPAYLMNNECEAEHIAEVGLMGRVPCKVIGAVKKGDMMVTSEMPGCAKAWREEGDPPYGSVIGKSLEDKDDNQLGEIEVVVGKV